MAITGEMRQEIYETLKSSFGDRVANGFMEIIPPVGWADVATKQDLGALEERMNLRFEAIDQRFNSVDERMNLRFEAIDQRFNSVDERMDLRFEVFESRLGERLESGLKGIERELREQANRFLGWVVGTAGVSLAVAGAIARFG